MGKPHVANMRDGHKFFSSSCTRACMLSQGHASFFFMSSQRVSASYLSFPTFCFYFISFCFVFRSFCRFCLVFVRILSLELSL